MPDVFISYATKDRTVAEALAEILQLQGWSLWWDRKISAGRSFDREIEQALEAAKCVIVLWSMNSVESEWVRNEATEAAARQVLIPVLIENVKLPLAFRRLQSIDLIGWVGSPNDARLSLLTQAVNTVAKMPTSSPPAPISARVELLFRATRKRSFRIFFGSRPHILDWQHQIGWTSAGTFYRITFDGSEVFRGNPLPYEYSFTISDAGAMHLVTVDYRLDEKFFTDLSKFKLIIDGQVLYNEGF